MHRWDKLVVPGGGSVNGDNGAKAAIRAERVAVMQAMGVALSSWRQQAGVQQQALARKACVSPTVVRRIEHGDYESPPPSSLIRAIALLDGPADELRALSARYRALQRAQHDAMATSDADDARTERYRAAGLQIPKLPVLPPRLVGREAALAALRSSASASRLVTLAGPPGVGKTTLATEFMKMAAPTEAGLHLFVDLAVVDGSSALNPGVAAQVFLESNETPVAERLALSLGGEACWLVLDNCEHLRDAVAGFASDVLTASTSVFVLVTSREPLGVPGELVITIEPLPCETVGACKDGTAMELFDELVMRSRGGSSLNEEENSDAAHLCQLLEGIPLALEIAAARARVLPIRTIRASVENGLGLLEGRSTTSTRHSGIAAALEWSWRLLPAVEQSALARLSAVASDVSFECATFVSAHDGVPGEQIVSNLLDRSLLRRVEASKTTRLRVPHVIRLHVLDRSPEDAVATGIERIGRWLEDFSAVDEVVQMQAERTQLLNEESNLLREVLTGPSSDTARAVRTAVNLWQFFCIRRHHDIGISVLRRLWQTPELVEPSIRGRAFGALGSLYTTAGDYEQAAEAARESVRIREGLGDEQALQWALFGVVAVAEARGDFAEARQALDRAISLSAAADEVTQADLLCARAILNLRSGHPDVEKLTRAIRLYDSCKADWTAVHAAQWLALALQHLGKIEDAAALLALTCERARGVSDTLWLECQLHRIFCEQMRDDRTDGLSSLDDALVQVPDVSKELVSKVVAVRVRCSAKTSPDDALSYLLAELAVLETPPEYWADAILWLIDAALDVAVASQDGKAAGQLLEIDRDVRQRAEGLAPPPPPQAVKFAERTVGVSEFPRVTSFDCGRNAVARVLTK